MPDYWETRKDSILQCRITMAINFQTLTGFNGYTNLECYLNCLSDYLVNGFNTGSCDIGIATGIGELSVESINIYPNPGYDQITLELPEMSEQTTIRITDAMGKIIMQKQVDTTKQVLDVSRLNPGLYEISITNKNKAGTGVGSALIDQKTSSAQRPPWPHTLPIPKRCKDGLSPRLRSSARCQNSRLSLPEKQGDLLRLVHKDRPSF